MFVRWNMRLAFLRSHFVRAALVALPGACLIQAAEFAIYRSTDDGHTWAKTGQGIPADLRTDALGESGSIRLAGTEHGVFISADDGRVWKRPARGLPESTKVSDFAVTGERTYAATMQGVWVSSDRGDTWALADESLAKLRVMSLAVVGETLVAGTDLQGARVLAAAGGRWENVSAGLPEGAQVFQLAVRNDAVYAALYAKGVYRLDLANRKWVAMAEEHPLRIAVSDGVIFAGRNPGGVFTSADGGQSWQNASAGLSDDAPTWCLASRDGTVLIGTRGDSRLLRYAPTFRVWKQSDEGIPPKTSPIAFGLGAQSVLVSLISDETPVWVVPKPSRPASK